MPRYTPRLHFGLKYVLSCRNCNCYILALVKLRLMSNSNYRALYQCVFCGKYNTDFTTKYKKKERLD